MNEAEADQEFFLLLANDLDQSQLKPLRLIPSLPSQFVAVCGWDSLE